MQNILDIVEKDLPNLLSNDESFWKSVYVDYHKPYVKRVWTDYEIDNQQYRIYLHEIEPCDLKESLFHPHPWRSIIKVLNGSYLMDVGYELSEWSIPEVLMSMKLTAGSVYEMSHLYGWHNVAPINESSLSLMITGTPWNRNSPKSDKELSLLNRYDKIKIIEKFKTYYKL